MLWKNFALVIQTMIAMLLTEEKYLVNNLVSLRKSCHLHIRVGSSGLCLFDTPPPNNISCCYGQMLVNKPIARKNSRDRSAGYFSF